MDAAYRGGATVAPPFLAGAMQRAGDAAYRSGATVAPPFLAGAMQRAGDAAYRGGATVAPPFLAGAMRRAEDAAYRGGATVAPPFLAGAMRRAEDAGWKAGATSGPAGAAGSLSDTASCRPGTAHCRRPQLRMRLAARLRENAGAFSRSRSTGERRGIRRAFPLLSAVREVRYAVSFRPRVRPGSESDGNLWRSALSKDGEHARRACRMQLPDRNRASG